MTFLGTTMEAPAQDKNLEFSILQNFNLYPTGRQAQSLYSFHLYLFIPTVAVLTNDFTTSQ